MSDNLHLNTLVESLGLAYSARFVPFSQSLNKNEKQPSLNWIVTISNERNEIQTDYMQGIGHLEGYKHSQGNKLYYDNAMRWAADVGKWNPDVADVKKFPDYNSGPIMGAKPIPAPTLTDVLYGLVSEAATIDYPTYEDWANEFGYDIDSRKGEVIYKQCLEIGLRLRAMLGDETLAKLREAFQDY